MTLSLLTTTVVLVAGPLFGQSSDKQSDKGQGVYQEQCVGCHGPDGHAQTEMGKKVKAADLTSAAVQQQSDSQLEKTIKGGKGKMPAFDQKLSSDDIHSVLAYVRQMRKND